MSSEERTFFEKYPVLHVDYLLTYEVNHLPHCFLDVVDTISDHTIEFRNKENRASVKFEYVSDTTEVERVCREQLVSYSRSQSFARPYDEFANEVPMSEIQRK
jgi:hypothetical protein